MSENVAFGLEIRTAETVFFYPLTNSALSPALLEEAVRDGDAVVGLPGGRGVVRALAPTKPSKFFVYHLGRKVVTCRLHTSLQQGLLLKDLLKVKNIHFLYLVCFQSHRKIR